MATVADRKKRELAKSGPQKGARKRARNVRAGSITDEKTYMRDLIGHIIEQCPQRQPTSQDERRASQIMRQQLEELNLCAHEHQFRFNNSLYANLALHFGLGSLGTAVSGIAPPLALALHLLAGGSYLADSTRRGYVLRRLFKFRPSQNIVATAPASADQTRLRIVLLAHVDAAFTGLLFDPRLVKMLSAGKLPPRLAFLNRSLALATHSQFLLAGFDLARIFLGPLLLPLRPVEFLLNLPALLAFVVNLELVLRNRIVPGANDDLSGVAALPILASRLVHNKPDDVELVFVVTGCEEASLGGADALARDKSQVWKRDRTVVLALDGLAGGELRLFEEGEIVRRPPPGWLLDATRSVTAKHPRFAEVEPFAIPVGASDAAAFLAQGYDAVGFGCVDPELGAPRHYHQMSDTLENLDLDKVLFSVDFFEKLIGEIVTTPRSTPSGPR